MTVHQTTESSIPLDSAITYKPQPCCPYVVRVRMRHVVQDDRLGQIPPEDAEILDVVPKNTNAIFLVQTMSKKTKQQVIAEPSPSWDFI